MTKRKFLEDENIKKLINDVDDYKRLYDACKKGILEAKSANERIAWLTATDLASTSLVLIEMLKIACTELDSRSENLLNK